MLTQHLVSKYGIIRMVTGVIRGKGCPVHHLPKKTASR